MKHLLADRFMEFLINFQLLDLAGYLHVFYGQVATATDFKEHVHFFVICSFLLFLIPSLTIVQ